MNRLFLLLLLIFACSASAPKNTTELTPKIIKRIDQLFKAHNNSETPGYAIGIALNGKAIYSKGYGAANLDYNIPITTQSAFSLASVSKQFTGACIALLVVDGKLSLEDPASKYIPGLKKYSQEIKVKHLVYNSSGLLDYYNFDRAGGKSWVTFNHFDIDECIATSMTSDTLAFDPGTQWNYSNINFMLLTKIVEKVSGMTFREFAQKRLFKPLGMENTCINDDHTQVIKNRATPYNIRNTENVEAYSEAGFKLNPEGDYIQHHRNAPHYGGSGVISTVEDLLKWVGNMHTKKFGGQTLYDQIHFTPEFDHGRNNQAMGLYFGDFNGRKMIAWDGGDYGISAQIARFPEQGLAIIVLSNLGTGAAYQKVNQIGDILSDAGIL